MNNTKRPNPDRIYEVINTILQRRHGVQITYELLRGENNEQHQDHR